MKKILWEEAEERHEVCLEGRASRGDGEDFGRRLISSESRGTRQSCLKVQAKRRTLRWREGIQAEICIRRPSILESKYIQHLRNTRTPQDF